MLTETEILEHSKAYQEHIDKLNALTDVQIHNLILADQCPYEPEHLLGVPLGMFHCPLCDDMVIAGVPHPRQHPPFTEEDLARLSDIAGEAEKVKVEEL